MKNHTPIIVDQKERELALSPDQSFIVQAPAGSGKTEILTRRFLKLLSVCEKSPEEIVAITFTKKAAHEMKTRILHALQFAIRESEEPTDDYLKATWQLAKEALKRDQQLGWQLLDNPHRLSISTFDAFCSRLTRHMPILSRFGSQPSIHQDPERLYDQAIEYLFEKLDEKNPCNKALLHLIEHCDNHLGTVKNLLKEMLKKRDQWLTPILSSRHETELRAKLEESLAHISKEALKKLSTNFPAHLAQALFDLYDFASKNLPDENQLLTKEFFLNSEKHVNLSDKNDWLWMSDWLLTKGDTLRRSMNKDQGFPALTASKNAEEKALFKTMKERMGNLLEQLSNEKEFILSLCYLRKTPDVFYSDQQWAMLESVLAVLPMLAAQLALVFQEALEVDFMAVAQAALNALGSEDEPTDTALYLDHQIRHLLIDEFQDTSSSQFHLIEKITQGWDGHDGRTLFIVGDPMQSIYRFREADVGLFLKARQFGIGDVALTPISLSVNFRSTEKLVEWFNTVFKDVFPTKEIIADGAVTYHSSRAIKNSDHSFIKVHPFIDSDEESEAKQMIQIILDEQKNHPENTMAILVKSRTHLKNILPMLRANDLDYSAVEIDSLNSRQSILDLLSLTKALLFPADRTAWLSLLRAPFCGLTLSDLHVIAHQDGKSCLLDLIQKEEIKGRLSDDGKSRLHCFLRVIQKAVHERGREPLDQWIKKTWMDLKGPACLDQEHDLDDVNTFFNALKAMRRSFSFSTLEKKLKQLYSLAKTNLQAKLHVMTIHKAKGLEFDTVILPQLHRSKKSKEKQLLLWCEQQREEKQGVDLLFAPMKSKKNKEDSLYTFLSDEDKKKEAHESIRLLYVAATRAKKRLHLLGEAKKTDDENALKTPEKTSFLYLLWQHVAKDFNDAVCRDEMYLNDVKISTDYSKGILRLSSSLMNRDILYSQAESHLNKKAFFIGSMHDETPAIIGTLVHRILQQISIDGLDQWSLERIEKMKSCWKSWLIEKGVSQETVFDSLKQVVFAVSNTLSDASGRWILSSHPLAQSEYSLSIIDDGVVKNIIIDRTFVDEKDCRWVIDYKTVFGDKDLKIQSENYREQLSKYSEAFSQLETRLIQSAIYFPVQKCLHVL